MGLALRIREIQIGEVTIVGPSCVVGSCGSPPRGTRGSMFPTDQAGVLGWTGSLRFAIPTIWGQSDAIVAVMALGIVTRLVAPLANDKRRDPAVIAIDEAGQYVIPVLGGHGAGANVLARKLAAMLGALPVITTASDTLGIPAVDEIGKDWGWNIERREDLSRVAASVVRGEPIAVFQDVGRYDWWKPFGPWPDHFRRVESWEAIREPEYAAALIISDRLEPARARRVPTVAYRPPTLVAGVGCKRGTSEETIASFLGEAFERHGLALGSLGSLATVTIKADEPGLIRVAKSRGIPLRVFSAEELRDQAGIERPSARVQAEIGIPSVAEAAALRASGSIHLLVSKQKGPGVTVAVARVVDAYQE
jgi:cobalamin biosynthesis protein CbiG